MRRKKLTNSPRDVKQCPSGLFFIASPPCCFPSSPLHTLTDPPFPPHKQLLMAVVGGASWGTHHHLPSPSVSPPSHCLPIVIPPTNHLTSSCLWGWEVGGVLSLLSVIIHPLGHLLLAWAHPCKRRNTKPKREMWEHSGLSRTGEERREGTEIACT